MDDTFDPTRALALADLLCGAAASDTHVAPAEVLRVVAQLETILGAPLDEAVHARVGVFDGAGFDLGATMAALGELDDGTRRMVLEAVVAVTTADRFVDSSELDYIAEVAGHLGLPMPSLGR